MFFGKYLKNSRSLKQNPDFFPIFFGIKKFQYFGDSRLVDTVLPAFSIFYIYNVMKHSTVYKIFEREEAMYFSFKSLSTYD